MLNDEELKEFSTILNETKKQFSGNVRIGIPLNGRISHLCTAGTEKLDIKYDGTILPCTKLEDVKNFIKERLNLPKEKADILILAGGGHEKFARLSGIKYEENTLYDDKTSPIMMDIKTRKKETERYFKEISLDEIRKKVDDPNWWYATRAMCAFALVVAEEIGAKYIIPTDISMVYGIIDKKINLKESKI